MNTSEPAIPGFQQPRQERSRRTLARIAAATEELLLERGPDRVTVQSVVARADTSVGAFYTRFESKDDAVAYVHRRFWDDVHRRWSDFLAPGRWRGVPAGMLIAEVVRRYCRIFLSDRARSRAFLLELLTRDDEVLLERLRTLHLEIARMMGVLLEERREELAHPRPREAAEQGFLRVLSAVRDHVLFGRGGRDGSEAGASRPGSGAEELILSLTRMYGGLLGVAEPPGHYGELLIICAASRRIRRF